ncbi:MAG: hypothetical protein K0S53_234 [Bacteroidetes bacterium]|jgi:hypothetical protein|nr:hypothetical protein [Bacteroidota bacterium]MDF2452737.1 hypothetical protein [Bacteroidota bacterium]
MIKLKEIIGQLKEENYLEIENNLIRSRADKFLFLFQSYKKSTISDREIKENLGVSSNSFFVLKSRLLDKIQDNLSTDLFVDHEKSIKMLLKVPEFCLNTPRETSIAYLLKLEKDLLRYNMHNELLVVYSALKKMHLNSDKYHHYSQLYNKQVSYGLSLEKAEEILGDFCRNLAQYDFSRSKSQYEKLCFLRNEINNIYSFCNSKQIELIKNFVELQLKLFCEKDYSLTSNIVVLLRSTRSIIDGLPLTLIYKKWEVVLDYLCFEYYYSVGDSGEAFLFYEKVKNQKPNLLLYNHIGMVSNFFMTSVKFCIENNKIEGVSEIFDFDKSLYDKFDKYSQIKLRVYNAMVYFHQKESRMAINCLNDLCNEYAFRDYFHQFLNIKLTLLHFYNSIGESEKARVCLKMLVRRIKEEKNEAYFFISYLLKAFDLELNKEASSKNILRQKELHILFLTNNKNNRFDLISHLVPELTEKHLKLH